MSNAAGAPTVSVAMCTYNGATFAADQIKSILAQTRPPMELVISDDGSTDGTIEVVQALAESADVPIRFEVNRDRKGFVENFLDTMARCEGDVIALADQDDVWAPTKLAVATRPFDDPHTTACVHEVDWVDDQLAPLAPRRRFRTGLVRRASVASPWFVPEGSRLLFRRRVLEVMPREPRPLALDTDDVDHPQVHDEWVGFAARALGRVAYLPVTLGLWRRHDLAYGFDRGAQRPAPRLRPLSPLPRSTQQHQARVAQSRIDYLAGVLSADRGLTVAERAAVAADLARYRKLLPQMRRREATYDVVGGAARSRAIASSTLRGTYGPQRRGGHGWIGLVQDLSSTRRDQ